jgi:hypothetical protein
LGPNVEHEPKSTREAVGHSEGEEQAGSPVHAQGHASGTKGGLPTCNEQGLASGFEGGLSSGFEGGLGSCIVGGVTGSVESILAVDRGQIEANFEDVPASSVQHFFVDTNTSKPVLVKEATGLDHAVTTPESIT